jgi:paraquat-inducible protein B
MIRKRDYFRLGSFIIGGTALFLVVVLVLGLGKFFKKTYRMETYLNESVNGLETGSQVKYRGVKVGTVAYIGFVAGRYVDPASNDYPYVFVLCDLDRDKFPFDSEKEMREAVGRDIEKGLRVRPISMGLTGQLFLGIDYVDPARNPLLPIDWKPENLYIPAAPSTLSRLEQAVTGISNTLGAIDKQDIDGLMRAVREITAGVSSLFAKNEAKGLGRLLVENLEETHKLFARINALVQTPEAERVLPEFAKAAAGVRRVVDASEKDVIEALRDSRAAMASLKVSAKALEGWLTDPKLKQNVAGVSKALESASEASGELRAAAAKLNAVLGRVNSLVAGEQATVESILENTRLLLENLRELSGEARRYPSGVLFGQPPGKASPARGE